jgi:hypothetical protein
MTDMVEKVARAIATAVGERDPLDPKFLTESAYGDMARAAIAAMRVPTEAMWASGAITAHETAILSMRKQQAVRIWQAMIDAALEGKG